MTLADVVLLVLIGLGFAVGFLRGTIRALLAIGAWAVCFIVAAYLRVPLGVWLSHNGSLDAFYAEMLAYAAIFSAIFIGVVLVIFFSRTPTRLTGHAAIDDILGGVIGVVAAVLVVAGVEVILTSYYGLTATNLTEAGLVAEIERALVGSPIAIAIHDTVVPWLAFLFGPLMPTEVLAVMV